MFLQYMKELEQVSCISSDQNYDHLCDIIASYIKLFFIISLVLISGAIIIIIIMIYFVFLYFILMIITILLFAFFVIYIQKCLSQI
jgi:hypothetical protein